MSGTSEGAKKAVAKILAKDPNHFSRIGKIGGQLSKTGGVYGDKKRAALIGKIGGLRSKRGYKFIKEDKKYLYYIDKTTGLVVRFKHDGTLENH